jgi:hypothetical protein
MSKLRTGAEWLVLLPLWRRLFKSQGWRIGASIATGAIWLIIIAAAAAGGGGSDDKKSAAVIETTAPATRNVSLTNTATRTAAITAAPTAAPTPAPTPAPAGPATTFGRGTKTVGQDIAPGIYRGNLDGGFCYWARLKGFSGEIGDIITNSNTSDPEIVEIAPTDAGFISEQCGEWKQGLTAITSSPLAPFEGGTFAVGIDVAPGTWAASGGSGCYWSRLSGFGQSISEIITNDAGSTSPIVTITDSDVGFIAHGCGTWTKQ